MAIDCSLSVRTDKLITDLVSNSRLVDFDPLQSEFGVNTEMCGSMNECGGRPL